MKKNENEFFDLVKENSTFLQEFLHRLLEPPSEQHFHSVSINKNQLIDRYEEAVRDLIHRYPSAHIYRKEQQPPPPPPPPLSIRSNRTSNLITPIQMPVVVHQQRPLQQPHRSEPRGSSPMQQDNEEHGSLPPPSSI